MNRRMKRQSYSKEQLQEKALIERIWDGNPVVFQKLCQLREAMQLHGAPSSLALQWLLDNRITGVRVIDFFNEEHGDETAGVLKGAKYIINQLNRDKFNKDPLRVKEFKK